jgi:hypothetical protein
MDVNLPGLRVVDGSATMDQLPYSPAQETAVTRSGVTDGGGNYRLDGLPPGQYYVAAGIGIPAGIGGTLNRCAIELATAIYPGVALFADARAINVSAALVAGVDFNESSDATAFRLLRAGDKSKTIELAEAFLSDRRPAFVESRFREGVLRTLYWSHKSAMDWEKALEIVDRAGAAHSADGSRHSRRFL